MSIKPVSVAASLGTQDQLRPPGNKPPYSNRFALLQDRSRSLSASGGGPPPLSPAVKRRSDEITDPLKGKNPRLDSNLVFAAMESFEVKLNKGKQGMNSLKEFLAKADSGVDNPLKEFLGGLVDALDSVFDTLTDLSSVVVDRSAMREPEKVRGRELGKVAAQVSEIRTATPSPPP